MLAGDVDRDFVATLLTALGGLEGARAAKTRTLSEIGVDIGDRLLERVQSFDASVRRTAPPSRGVFHVATIDRMEAESGAVRMIALQRTFEGADGDRHFNVVLADDGADVAIEWLEAVEHPLGVAGIEEGAVFRYADNNGDCEGLKVVRGGEVVYESCDARIVDAELVEVRNALVDETEAMPQYFRRNVIETADELAIEQAMARYASGDYRGAVELFERALADVDPLAPYDASDLVYNRARALELGGERQRALELYRSLGDVSYQHLVDEGAGRIEGAPR